MSELAIILGNRLRSYRKNRGYSQERLAELANCHPNYIGQLKRGEKNATLESIEKLSSALEVSFSELFDKLGDFEDNTNNFPLKCYELVASKSSKEQEQLFSLLKELEKYKEM